MFIYYYNKLSLSAYNTTITNKFIARLTTEYLFVAKIQWTLTSVLIHAPKTIYQARLRRYTAGLKGPTIKLV